MLGPLISAICLNVADPTYRTACEKALIAGTMQYGLYQQAELLQSQAQDYVTKKARRMTGEKVWMVGGIAYAVYQTVERKEILYSFQARPVADNATVNLGLSVGNPKGSITLTWHF